MKSFNKPHFWQLGGLITINVLLFGGTNAQEVPSIVLFIGLLVVALTFYTFVHAVLEAVKLYGVSVNHSRRLAGGLTLLASGLLAWQSIGELKGYDVIVLLPLIVLAGLYSAYNTGNQRKLTG